MRNQLITDPAQITAKQKFDIQPFTIEKLYMTRAVGDSSWSPDDKQVAFVTNITGRYNIWLVSIAERLADATHRKQSTPGEHRMVTQGPLDRLQL